MFATIADRYDFITVALSYGRDRRWKQRVASLTGMQAGETAVDLACGTGDIALRLADAGGHVVGLDLTPAMLALARRKDQARRIRLVQADMTHLPFGDASADVVTAGYGIRNVPDLDAALAEVHRVLRPGGRFVALDFNKPANPVLRSAYLGYLTVVGSVFGWVLHGDPDTYRYIPASIRHYPGADVVVERLVTLGFDEARWEPVLGGLMAIHVGRKKRRGD
ncbi:MAG: ubiE 3 [Acidobacteria bacterium]|jgi:demethylmenaquinone methyltransferase/2-methoxy-6-polyprenyl-1,4-benzoquinol methylase|nr:ubiE 3 [Acidobacteriota bacterium]